MGKSRQKAAAAPEWKKREAEDEIEKASSSKKTKQLLSLEEDAKKGKKQPVVPEGKNWEAEDEIDKVVGPKNQKAAPSLKEDAEKAKKQPPFEKAKSSSGGSKDSESKDKKAPPKPKALPAATEKGDSSDAQSSRSGWEDSSDYSSGSEESYAESTCSEDTEFLDEDAAKKEDEDPAKIPKEAPACTSENQTATKEPETTMNTQSQATGPKTIYMTNMPYRAEFDDIKLFFASSGEVIAADFPTLPSGRSTGNCHVEFVSAEAASKALEEKNGKFLMGRPVKLTWDTTNWSSRET